MTDSEFHAKADGGRSITRGERAQCDGCPNRVKIPRGKKYSLILCYTCSQKRTIR